MTERDIAIRTGQIHKLTRRAVDQGRHVIIHRGGTGSGKTYDIMIFLIFSIASQQKNKIITIASESRPHLEIGVIRIMKEVMQKHGIWHESRWHRTLSKYTFETGSIIEFFSADRIGKALGARRDWLFGNEINSLSLDVWDELARRSQNVIGDFNPVSQFWLEDWLENYDDTEVIISNYTFNEFLSDIERSRILRRAERDANFKRIHIDCEYGVYEGLVFTEWQQIDQMPEGGAIAYGLDFGFTNDPSTLIKVAIKGNDLFADELIYQTGLLNRDISRLMKQLGVGNDEVYADSAEPKSIQEIFLAGFNVKPSIKGQGSVNAGIDKLKSYNIKVTKRSVNLIKELRNYAWVSDKEGNPTNKPMDAFNHGIDSMRYAIFRDEPPKTTDPEKVKGMFY